MTENKHKKWFYVLLVLVIGLLIFLVFKEIEQNKKDAIRLQYIEEKNALRDELDDLIDNHDELLDEYGDLTNQLDDKDSIIQSQIAEIRNLLRTKKDLGEARKKILLLQKIAKRYLSNIDSLLLINENLTIEKDSVIKENKNINWRNYKLSRQNKKLAEKVSKGSILKVLNLETKGLKYRGTGKEVATRFAKKVQKLRFCLKIAANQIAEAEEKKVYVQLIAPNGELVKGNEDIIVSVIDSTFNCTAVFRFNYQNVEISDCFEWERVELLERGEYLVNLIIEGRISSQQQFNLR